MSFTRPRFKSLTENDLVKETAKVVCMLDTSGHQKYAKTLYPAMFAQEPAYALLCISVLTTDTEMQVMQW